MRILSSMILASIMIFPTTRLSAESAFAWPDANTLVVTPSNPVIDPALTGILNSIPDDSSTAVWVFFTDKGIFEIDDYDAALRDAESRLSPAALKRRHKARGIDNPADFRDLPVYDAYVDDVLSTGAKQRHLLKWFNALTVDAGRDQIESISRLNHVRFIKPVSFAKTNIDVKTAPLDPNMILVSLDYGSSYGQLDQINLISAQELGFAGQGIIVCMMDTGFRQGHDAFQNIIDGGRLIAQYDFINGDDNTDYDPNQEGEGQPFHGTLTWSTLGGESSGNLYGPAYQAAFVLAKTEDVSSERHIEEDNWAAGAEWADGLGASVISASLGYRWFDSGEGDYSYEDLDGNTTIVTIAADLAAYNGIAVATAMGNEGNSSGSLLAPADGDSVIACGAVLSTGELAGFSSFGPTFDGRTKPEVCAQGVNTVCVDPYSSSGYMTASGTSLSTPLVGGVSAVLLSAHPNWSPMMVREALMMTAGQSYAPDNAYGWGVLDAGRALYYHPEGDIIFDHSPVLYARSNSSVPVAAGITGGAGIANAYLYYRVGDTGAFSEIMMSTSNGQDFDTVIPGQSGSFLQYYLKAVDTDGNYSFYPVGGENHPIEIGIDIYEIGDSFEDGPQLWKSYGTNDSWGISARYSSTGNLSITDSPANPYRPNTDSKLESTFALELSNVTDANLSFLYRGELQNGNDFLYAEASTDGGATWNQFPQSITGYIPNFTPYTVSLNDYLGQPDLRLRFRLVSDGSTEGDGVFIDDVTISMTIPENIPTLTEWGMIFIFWGFLALTTMAAIRKRIWARGSDEYDTA